jgi:hypothetical protein
MTNIAAPVFESFCSLLETDVTRTFIRSSRLNCVKSSWGGGRGTAFKTAAVRKILRPRRTKRRISVFILVLTGNLRAGKECM